jgi:putative hydrolase of HD superfamily
MPTKKEDRVLTWAVEAGVLKRAKRTGWWCSGVKDPESVAEHTYRMSLLASYIAAEEGADPLRAGMLGLVHDLPEARVGDVHAAGKRYMTGLDEADRKARRDQNAVLPEGRFRKLLESLDGEWADVSTPEARAAKDADYLECALQAVEYFWNQPVMCREWVDSNLKKLKTPTAKRLGARLRQLFLKGEWDAFQAWWRSFYVR